MTTPFPGAPRVEHPPDVPREPLHPKASRKIAHAAAKAALATAYRATQPTSPDPYAEAPDRPLLRRLYYQSDDGWQGALFRLSPAPGGSGEPVVLAQGLALNRHCMDYGPELSLARAIAAAGFEVFLLEHRAHRTAIPPAGAARDFDFDDVVAQDVPAAVEAIVEVTGFPRVHWIGHAMGGQLLYAFLAHWRGDCVASATTLCAPVRFSRPESGAASSRLLRALIPRAARLPARAAAALASPRVSDPTWAPDTPGGVARGVMLYGTEDLSGAMARQALRWLHSGGLCDRDDRIDYVEAMRGLQTPLLVVTAHGDPLCPPDAAAPALEALSGPQSALTLDGGWGHMDPLLGRRAPEIVFPRIVEWLQEHRTLAWED